MSDTRLKVYEALREHLDKMPVGLPASESGIELKLLKILFTPEDAKLAMKLNFMPDPLKKIYRRVKKYVYSKEALEQKLDAMYEKGLINFGKEEKEDGKIIKYYANAPLVIGMFEYQLGNLTPEFINTVKQYFEETFFEEEYNKSGVPQLRTIPIEKSLSYEQKVSTYDDLRSIIENSGGPIAVAQCICRQAKDLLGDPCKKTDLREICFTFRNAALSYKERGLARIISKEEALKILEKVDEAGLVLQPGNSQRPMCICCCCGCCCEVLTNQKRFDKSSQFFATNFYAEVNSDECVGCGLCVDRCNMDAIDVIEDISMINVDRCIGCGACVPTCPNEAISLKKKDQEIVPPKNTAATYMTIMDKKAEIARQK